MKFSVAFEMQRPSLDDNATVNETIDQCILADETGWDYIWMVEHHFLTGFSMSPCPEVMFGALSRLTKRIRLGFGVVILPYHHPVRVAERVAMVDQLSNGRVEFGTGRSAPYEQTGMGIDPRNTREMWEESLEMIPKIWESDMFEWEGKYWKVPLRKVLPKPYQKPHPPIWMAAVQPASYELAAKKGLGVMAFGAAAPAELAPYVKKYREDIKNAEPVGKFVNNQWQTSIIAYCGEDDREAKELCTRSLKTFFGPGKPYLQDQKDVYQNLLKAWGGVPDHLKTNFSRYVTEIQDETTGEIKEALDLSGGAARQAVAQLDADTLCERGVIVAGDPESCIKAVKLHEEAGIDQVHFLIATETIPHEKVMKSIEMFGKYVIPEFKKSEVTVATAD